MEKRAYGMVEPTQKEAGDGITSAGSLYERTVLASPSLAATGAYGLDAAVIVLSPHLGSVWTILEPPAETS
ncbi:hypothetical protein [Chondromyces crocatus]|uniref:Uncharacterized protein n=1 Tax=Chondromyces crocatus TaxID=52 RepID=A0A0K1ESV3_CHOCO|nr:hypothetical protein [Chondromyces crocatus]AKT43879.1 uncharacterized protein CMC5_081160 [Chondromyces crocatus]